jgi:7,8-dihydropterin-6-yl-methyl-4-(beta-D-ribofuranosyl)aminobenzene 5'-phosphate synthase
MLHRVHVLSDNKALPGFESEHGLSLLLEMGNGQSWLWDTGQGRFFQDNAARMGLNLDQAVGCALSHGHYDHSGGIPHLLQTDFSGPIVGHPKIFEPRFHVPVEGKARFIGNPHADSAAAYPGFAGVSSEAAIAPGLWFMTSIARRPGNFQAVAHFFFDAQGTSPDPVEDDACLVADLAHGPVLILGCCHSGLANTLLDVAERLGRQAIFAVIGGLHLMNSGEEDFYDTLTALDRFKVKRVYAGHCTGKEAQEYMSRRFPGQWVETKSGLTIEI